MICAALDYWLCSVLGREGFTYGPILTQFFNHPDQGIRLSIIWSGYLVSFIARAKFRIRCVLGESKLQSTLSHLICLVISCISALVPLLLHLHLSRHTHDKIDPKYDTKECYQQCLYTLFCYDYYLSCRNSFSPSSKTRRKMRWSEALMSGNYTRERCS